MLKFCNPQCFLHAMISNQNKNTKLQPNMLDYRLFTTHRFNISILSKFTVSEPPTQKNNCHSVKIVSNLLLECRSNGIGVSVVALAALD